MIRLTSIEAYRDLRNSGKQDTARAKVLKGVIDSPKPLTRLELSHRINMPINAVCGRVNELIKAEVIQEVGTGRCMVSGKTVNLLAPVGETCQLKLAI